MPHERLSRAFGEAAFGHVHPRHADQVARHRARLVPRAIHHHQRHSLLLRGHPDEVLSYEEVKRYWKQPTRNVFVEQATS